MANKLIEAVKANNIEAVKIAIEHGADVHALDDYALQWAAENGHTEIVKLLEQYLQNYKQQKDKCLQYPQ